MANAINLQIVDALIAQLKAGISIVQDRVYGEYLSDSQVPGTPAICLYVSEERTENPLGISSTRRKEWDMTIAMVAYTSGTDSRAQIYDLVKRIENAIELTPKLGLGSVQAARVVGKTIASIGTQNAMFQGKGMAEITVSVRFRTNIGAA